MDQNKSGRYLLFLVSGLAVVYGLFFPFTMANLWWREALNSGHVLLFFFISLALYSLFSARSFFASAAATYAVVLVSGFAIGVAIEILQTFFQREAGVDDLFRNFFGIAAGLSFVVMRRQKQQRNKIMAGIFLFVFLLLGVSPLLKISWDYVQRDNVFPSITMFEEKWFTRFLFLNNAVVLGAGTSPAKGSETLYRIRFDPGKYSGVGVAEPEKNWSAYRELQFQVLSNNAENIKLILKIYDVDHNQNYNDRFNQRLIIYPGLNEIKVNLANIRDAPMSREMDLANISGIQLFIKNVEYPLFLEFSNLLLEK